MAEARCAVTEPPVAKLYTGDEYQRDIFRQWQRSIVRRFYRTRNLLYNGMWPTSLWNLGILVLLLSACMIGDWQCCNFLNVRLWTVADFIYVPYGLPKSVRATVTSLFVGFWFFLVLLYVRRFILRCLLSYRGWMYEQPKTQSVSTIIWGLLVRLVSGYNPKLYSCQQSLPRMPVPTLRETLDGLMTSLEPLFGDDDEKWSKLKKDAEEFEKTVGPKLQRVLVLKSWWSQNYVTDWWEKYVYLMSRGPLPVNSNYYIMDQEHWTPSKNRTARAASSIFQFLTFKQLCDREQLETLLIRRTIPLCMAQYQRLFSTTRIPGEEIDTLLHYDSSVSKHLAVIRKGIIYKMDVFDKKGKLLTRCHIQKLLDWIIDDADKHLEEYSEEARILPALTGTERTTWAKVRSEHFSQGINRESMDIIEKAIFMVILETDVYGDMSSRGNYLLCGKGGSFWFDKCFNLISFPDGRIGFNCEHSYADAPVIAHLAEFNYTDEALQLCGYRGDGSLEPRPNEDEYSPITPQRLVWDVKAPLATAIKQAHASVLKSKADLDHCVRELQLYGKGFMKRCKVSPDAYIQMALQITYFKNAGKFALTYESSMTRLYLQGRTETVRSLSSESVKFVRAFLDKDVSKKEKMRLLQEACTLHQNKYRDAMAGRGIDRHLFALYVVGKGMGYNCDFLKEALLIPWTLSTSQQPQQQIASSPDCNLPQYRNCLCPGGGFGPVSDDGYGVSYMIPGDNIIFFHVSAKKSAPGTNASRFMDQLFETFQEMKDIFATENGAQ